MPVLGPETTSNSSEKQGFSAGRGTDSGTVTDAGKASGSKEDRWQCFSIRVVKGCEFRLASSKWLNEESVDDADDSPEPEELATDTIAELKGAVKGLTAVLTVLEKWRKTVSKAELRGQLIQLPSWTDPPEGRVTKGVPLVGTMA